MDSSEPGERCLPEMGLSGWMKRTMERSYDLSDFCTSPPADGFYYSQLQKGLVGKGNCVANSQQQPLDSKGTRACTVMGGVLSINQPISQLGQAIGTDASIYHPQHHLTAAVNGFVPSHSCIATPGSEARSSSSTTTTSSTDYTRQMVSGVIAKQMSLGLTHQHQSMSITPSDSPTGSEDGKDLLRTPPPEERRTWTSSASADGNMEMYRHTDHHEMSISTDDSAPVDSIITPRVTPTIVTSVAEEGGGGSLRLVDKLGMVQGSCPATPDVTPCTTPAVTPACSPQISRRAGNPFFTGNNSDESSDQSGSWLFRPGKKPVDASGMQSDKLYEAKVEFQQSSNSKAGEKKKTIRYVPRPSELRELNFWSPTSM